MCVGWGGHGLRLARTLPLARLPAAGVRAVRTHAPGAHAVLNAWRAAWLKLRKPYWGPAPPRLALPCLPARRYTARRAANERLGYPVCVWGGGGTACAWLAPCRLRGLTNGTTALF